MCSSATLSSLGLPSSMVAANSFSVSCWINVVLSPFAVLMAFRKVTVNRLTTQPCTQIFPQPRLVRPPDSLSDKAEPQAQLEGTPWHRVYARLQFNRWSHLALAHAPMVNKGVSTFTLYTHSLVVSSKTSSFDKEQVSTVRSRSQSAFLNLRQRFARSKRPRPTPSGSFRSRPTPSSSSTASQSGSKVLPSCSPLFHSGRKN